LEYAENVFIDGRVNKMGAHNLTISNTFTDGNLLYSYKAINSLITQYIKGDGHIYEVSITNETLIDAGGAISVALGATDITSNSATFDSTCVPLSNGAECYFEYATIAESGADPTDIPIRVNGIPHIIHDVTGSTVNVKAYVTGLITGTLYSYLIWCNNSSGYESPTSWCDGEFTTL
jgi:hypothetical protein